MATEYTVHSEVSGKLPKVSEVTFERDFDTKPTSASFRVVERSTVENLQVNEDITIKKDGNPVWRGEIEDIPFDVNTNTQIKATSSFRNTFDFNSRKRTFYNRDVGDVMNELINKKVKKTQQEIIDAGDDITDWASVTSNTIELVDFREKTFNEYGTDMVYLQFPEGKVADGFTRSNLQYDGDKLACLDIDFIANNPKRATYRVSFEYRDKYGKNYRWTGDNGNGYKIDGRETVKLPVVESNPDANIGVTTNNKLRMYVESDGKLLNTVGFTIDSIRAQTFDIEDRDTGFSGVQIGKTGNKISRVISGNVGYNLRQLSDETKGNVIVTADNVVKYKRRRESDAGYSIDESTPTVDFDDNRNLTDVKNRVKVSGDGFTVSEKDSNSISLYNTVKTETFSNPDIKRESEARNKAKEILRKKSFRSAILNVKLPPLDILQDIEVGDEISVDKGTIEGEFTLKEIKVNKTGEIVLNIIVPEDRNRY